ncbi:DUF86 domain-containing protein [Beijerinckia sp. L45]|uniref:HepT-like ribonuclease domain-containing protein n=1 Tax=Beijerinckia sp. L45 TaxID=1641855 RepID=UPI00131E5C79|nr:HepT-like ribonuclease domain-containing protein [Beijerinckia sp. L45]
MLSEAAKTALVDLRYNIVLPTAFIEGFDLDSFKADQKTFYAATRALEIISEASRRLPNDLKARHSHIEWLDMRNAGNKYRHEYDDVAPTLVWMTIQESLPPLLKAVESELV